LAGALPQTPLGELTRSPDPAGGAYTLPRPLAEFKRPTSKGKEGRGREEGRRREGKREGKGKRKGREGGKRKGRGRRGRGGGERPYTLPVANSWLRHWAYGCSMTHQSSAGNAISIHPLTVACSRRMWGRGTDVTSTDVSFTHSV